MLSLQLVTTLSGGPLLCFTAVSSGGKVFPPHFSVADGSTAIVLLSALELARSLPCLFDMSGNPHLELVLFIMIAPSSESPLA
jgi:hypothetical protein